MAGSEFLDTVRDALGGAGLGRLYTPILSPANAAQVAFTGFGIANAGASFSTSWQFDMDANSDARSLQTFSAGTVYYEAGPLGEPGRLVLRNADVFGELVRRDTLPDWFPLPQFIVYAHVEPASIERRMKDYFARNPRIGVLLQRVGGPVMGSLEQAFLNGPVALPPVPVPAGLVLGEAAAIQSGRRMVAISMQQELDNAGGLYLDPAIYHLHWQDLFADLANHALRDRFIRPFGGPVANGVARYVSQNGGDNAPYLTAADATDSIQDAIDAARDYDTIVILDAESYDEGDELLIEKPLTLTSLSVADVITMANPALPIIDGDDDNRGIHVRNVAGVVALANLAVANGEIATGSLPRAGAGVLIERSHATYVHNCHIHHNAIVRNGLTAANGFGAGIHCHHSSAFLFRNRIADNRCSDRGAGIGVWGQGWPIIQGNVITRNETRENAVGPQESRPDGGGIGIENGLQDTALGNITDPAAWSQQELAQARRSALRILDNEIANNAADDDGGGIYLTWLSRAELRNNHIHNNTAAKAAGGIRATEACELFLEGDRIRANEANFGQADPAERRNGGGGMALRNASARLQNVMLEGNIVHGWAGGGLFFNSVDLDDGTPGNGIYAAVLNNILRPGRYRLEIDGGAIQDNHSRLSPGDAVDHRRGGGIYVLRASTPPVGGPGFGLPFDVTIHDIARIAGNHLDPGPLPLGAPQSVELHVEDQVHRAGNPIDDANKATFVTGTRFFYQSP